MFFFVEKLSLFQRFSEICNKKGGSESSGEYRLYAFVVGGRLSGQFKASVRRNLAKILRSTPSDLAVMTFVQSPDNWSLVEKKLSDRRSELICSDYGRSQVLYDGLRGRLGLGDSPAVVLSDNLMSSVYAVLPVAEDECFAVLKAAGRYLDANAGKVSVTDMAFLREVGCSSSPFRSRTEDGEPLAKNIMEVLAVTAAVSGGEKEKPEAARCVSRTLRRLKRDAYKFYDEEEKAKTALDRYSSFLTSMSAASKVETGYAACLDAEIDNCSDEFVTMNEPGIRRISRPRNSYVIREKKESDSFRIDPRKLKGYERESISEIVNYNLLLPTFFDGVGEDPFAEYRDLGLDFLDDDILSMDYKPLGNRLGNVVEEELNASVIQLIRTLFGIEMPGFFKVFDRNHDWCPIGTRDTAIYFNKRNKKIDLERYSVKSVMLGGLACALREKAGDDEWSKCLGVFADQEFIDTISEFAGMRNVSSHPGKVTREEFVKLFFSFRSIMEKYIPLMHDIKRYLKVAPLS